MNRRLVLKKGLWGGALLALGGSTALAFRDSALEPVLPEGLGVLRPVHYAVVCAIARRLIPIKEGFASPDELEVGRGVDLILARADSEAASELKQLLRLFENALSGLLFGGRTRPFTRLPPEEQDEVLREWRDSRLTLRRTGFQALRTVVLASYYGNPQSWPALGYPGPPRGFFQPRAPVWKGGGVPNPNRREPEPAPVPEPALTPTPPEAGHE